MLPVSSHSGDPVAQELREAGVPLGACGKPIGPGSKVSHVAADDRDGARDMVRHPLSLGRRRIGVVTGPPDTPGGAERLAGYREVLTEAGVAVDERLIVSGDYSRAGGEAGAERLLARAPGTDAVFVASDLMAQGVLTARRRAGRRVPQDVAVGGFDDSPAVVAVSPAADDHPAAVGPDQRGDGAGAAHADRREDPAAVILPTELVKRASTQRGPARDGEPRQRARQLVRIEEAVHRSPGLA
ncbi:LacI family DNA-binding transcriptional regulator [Streptomyces chromofuscus]|uniref:LacI family DNA-binding transcriptional regulator n=1 Tax=Streptomyces chromofuscus TaxID=42881 RepID=UPI0019B3DD47|nr:substrate-binding domain-containing protein [Streptomyces chromofuscus]GGT40206.1 hypothetical protein GCM10010254_70100 [Streptomyces chromofuscus]